MNYSIFRTVSTLRDALDLAEGRFQERCSSIGLSEGSGMMSDTVFGKEAGLYFSMKVKDVLKYNGSFVVEFKCDQDHGVMPRAQTNGEEYKVGLAMELCFKRKDFRRLEDALHTAIIRRRDGTVVEVVEWK